MIEKLFTSKNRIKILGFLFFEKEESYIREISNKTKVSPSAVKREVENLEKVGIFKREKNKVILNKESNILDELKNIFIKTDYVVYPIKDSLKEIHAEFILIFGSFARGDYKEGSDIDLLIIGRVKSFEVYKKIKPIENKIKREINCVVWTIENLKKEKNSGFVKDIFKKGVIMIKGEENEIRRIIG